jgi:BetI-type transcriptional repressor, C-terminal
LIWCERLTALLEHGHDAGIWRCNDAPGTAWRIAALLDGLVGYLPSSSPDLTRAQATQHLRIAIARELGTNLTKINRR